MKFVYQYRSRDNSLHSGVIRAADRESVYAELRERGIRPSKVEEAPGWFNKWLGKGKRWSAIVALALIAAALAWLWLSPREVEVEFEDRAQVYGDPSFLQLCRDNAWSNVFTQAGDLLLVRYAQPGAEVEALVTTNDIAEAAALIDSVASSPHSIAEGELDEVKKMKRILNGMKQEYLAYRADGGSAEGYVERLMERQRIEANIATNVKSELDSIERRIKTVADLHPLAEEWTRKTTLLREMGMKSYPMPDELVEALEK